jgi:integrase
LDGETWEPPAAKARRIEPFGEYAAEWITRRRVKGKPLRPRTREEYERLLAGPLSALAGFPMSKITRDHIDKWHSDQSATGKLTQTSRGYALIKAVFADALDRGTVTATPARVRGGASPNTGRKVTPPSTPELALVHAAMLPMYQALVTVAASGGLRYGEIAELRRKDITKRPSGNATIRVERAVVFVKDGPIVGPPKSLAGVRSVTLPTDASLELFAHLERFVPADPNALIFPALDGAHMPLWKFAPHWRRARHAAERPDLGIHALRHYALTQFASTPGATLAAIMGRAGHSTVATAMNYQHAAADLDAEIAARMSENAQASSQ